MKIKKMIPMRKQHITSGSTFEEQIGYSRALVCGNWIFVSGTTGFDYETMTISDDIVVQADQCIRNIQNALQNANASLEDVVRITYILPDASDFEACWPLLRNYFGTSKPAATMIAAGLSDPRMKIEIQVTAIKQSNMQSKEVRQTLNDFVKGGDTSDVELLASTLHKNYRNVQSGFFTQKGIFHLDKEEYIGLIKEGTFGGSPRTTEVIHLEVLGDLAYARVRLKSKELQFESLIVLVKEDHKWWLLGNYPSIVNA
jgi:enamine deaminase RidA (YjgF/YER057c/UK114 family)